MLSLGVRLTINLSSELPPPPLPHPALQVWQIPEDHVKFESLLAAGAFGEVWRGAYGGQTVAIKLLKRPLDDEFDPEAAEDYEGENQTLQHIRHPHLLIFIGSGTTREASEPTRQLN